MNISETRATLYDIKQFSVNSRAENSKIVLNFTGDTKLTFKGNYSELAKCIMLEYDPLFLQLSWVHIQYIQSIRQQSTSPGPTP